MIIGGRILDVTIGTVRTIFVVQGRRGFATVLGFFEVLVWIFIAAKVINGISDNAFFALSYALGFSLGNYVGVTVENWLAFGHQALIVISPESKSIARTLRERGVRLTEFMGEGRDGPTGVLMMIIDRHHASERIDMIRKLDEDCFYVVEDIRASSMLTSQAHQTTGWRAVMKRK
jgi:uncharacterized protein YebE (UPF0316 family)